MPTPIRLPDQAELTRLLSYNAETGQLIWKARADAKRGWNTKNAGNEAGCLDRHGYRVVAINRVLYKAHRIIWKLVYGNEPDEIDHINGARSDNRLSNLRGATRPENCRNMPRPRVNSSGRKGVSFDKERGLWSAKIQHNGKTHNLGRFASVDEAHQAYRSAASRLHGNFARFE